MHGLLQAHLEKIDGDIRELIGNSVGLKSNEQELILLRHVIEKIGTLFADTAHLEIPFEEDGGQLGFMAGVINREKIISFETMMWRVSRGNVFVRKTDIEEPFEDFQTVRIQISLQSF